MTANEGSRQHSGKRDKFTQAVNLLEEIKTLSDRAWNIAVEDGNIPVFDVSMIKTKADKLLSLIEVRRGESNKNS